MWSVIPGQICSFYCGYLLFSLQFCFISSSSVSFDEKEYDDLIDKEISALIASEKKVPRLPPAPRIETSKPAVRQALLQKYRAVDANWQKSKRIMYSEVEIRGWPKKVIFYGNTDWTPKDMKALVAAMDEITCQRMETIPTTIS